MPPPAKTIRNPIRPLLVGGHEKSRHIVVAAGHGPTAVDRGHAAANAVGVISAFACEAANGRLSGEPHPHRVHANAKPPNPSTHSQRGNGIWGSLNWTYDLVGNRTSETLTGSTANTFNYPATSNQLASVTQGAITLRGFSYDGAGNVTADNRGGTTYNYRYNQRGRLDELTIGATVTADYVYDGLERMAVRTTQNMSPAGTTHYLYDLKGHLLVEADSTGQTLREYVWIDDLPLAVVADVNTASPNLYYVHADQVNRPLKMTDGSEAVVWNATYRPFGEIVSITGSASNNLRFPGQYFLIEDGLHYNWYRHYDPTLGRYLQADPLGFISGPNLFEYALSIPQMAADPTGRFAPIIVGIGIVAAYALRARLENQG
jgi:RHS repeat-associated protein